MIFISDNDLTIRVQRLRRTDPVGGYTLYMHYGMGNRYYTLPVEDTGDEYVMVFVIPASFTRGLASGEYTYSIMADSRIVTSGMARKKEVNFPADTVYAGTVESGNRYTVLISAPVGGFLYVDGERYQTYRESVPEGQEILVQAVPDEHHTFDQWSDGETENPRTVVVNNDITLAASFEAVEYTVSISAGSNGSVTVNNVPGDYSQTVPYGTVLTIEGTGSTGYGFTGWSDGSLENPRQYTVEGDTTLTASFALGTYIVTITSGFNGSVSVNGVQGDYSQAVQHGTQLTVEALPDTGYSFDQWTDGNTDNPRTITVTGPITLSSAYEALTYSVSVSAGANGSVSVNGTIGNYSETVAYGTILTIEGTGSTGYGFDQWSDGNTDNPRTLTVTGDVTLTASFAVGMYRVNISAGQNGSVEVDGISGDYSQSVAYGTQLAIEAFPGTGYDFDTWSDNVADNPRTITVTGDITLSASFQIQEFTVTLTAGTNGLISVNGGTATSSYSGTATYGSTVTVEAVPNTGFNFTQWSDGNTDNPRTITVTGAVNLTAAFEVVQITYNVSVSAGQNGSVSVNNVPGNYSATVPAGTQLTIEAIANQDYDFTTWSDGVSTNPRTLTVNADTTLTAAFQAQVQPSALNTIRYTTTDSQVNSTWLTAYDDENNALTPTETDHYGRIVFGEPVHKIVVNTNNASNIESITTSYKTEVVDCSGLNNLTNCTSLTLKSPHLTSVNFTPFTALQNLWSGHANDDAQYTGASNLPASGTCTTRTDNNLWEHSDLSGWTFQALGTVITYEAEEQMDLTDHNVYNRHTEGVQPASHTFADGVGTITYTETVGELRDNWQGCDKLYLPDTVGYFNYTDLLSAIEVGEYFGIVGGSMYAGEDWHYQDLFENGINPSTAVTVRNTNPILTIGTDGCLYNKEDWMGLNIVNMNGSTLDMDDRCVDASTCMFTEINERWPYTITRLTLGDNCESLKLYDIHNWDRGLVIGELVLNDALQSFNPNRQQIGHASGGSNNPYLNVTNSGYAIESEDGTTLYWCGSNQVDLSGYTHFAEACCGNLSFSSMPDISSAAQIDNCAFYGVSGLSTWVWPDNDITFNGGVCVDSGNITRMEFGNRSVSFNNADLGWYAGQFSLQNLTTVVFNSQLAPTQDEQYNQVFSDIPTVGTVYIPLGSDYSTFLNYGGNAANIGLWNLKYIMDNTQLAIRHTPGVTITAPTLTGLTMVASADSNGWLKVTYSGDITAYDSTDLQNNTDVLEIVLPDSCLSVGNGAFLGCSNLAKVTVGDSCTSIGNSAFYSTAISEFSAKGVTSFGSGAFGGCTSLTSVEFGENLATLGNGLFYNCSSLEYVGFEGVTGPTITNNDLGSGIHATGTIYIPRYANDASYADFIAAMPSGWTVIRRKQNQILYQTTNNQKLNDVPDGLMYDVKLLKHTYFNGWGVLEYSGDKLHGVQDFLPGRTTLSYISLPEMDGPVDYTSFSGCTSLTSVEVEDCTYIEYDAFRDCPITDFPTANTLIVPASTQFVAEGAYSDFGGTTIMFNPALTRLSGNVINLQNVTDVYVYTTHTMEDWGDPFTNTPASGTLHMVPGADVPYWTQYLSGWTVANDISLITYTSSDSRKVEVSAASFDAPLVYNYCDGEGNGVLGLNGLPTRVYGPGFSGTSLSTIGLPPSVTYAYNAAFRNCDLTDIKINNGQNQSGLCSKSSYVERHCLMLYSQPTSCNLDVGTSTTDITTDVKSIQAGAFRGNKALTELDFDSYVTYIGDYAFKDCSNLTKLVFHNFSEPVPSLGTDVFDGVAPVGKLYGRQGKDFSNIMNALPRGWTCVLS